MPRNWTALVEASEGLYEIDDFKRAMYQLVVQQCLYLRQRDQAVAYRLITSHRREFGEALDLMGLRLGFNDRLEYCYVVQDGGHVAALDLQETLFLLTLRHVYHLRAGAGDLTPDGDAVVGIPEFEESYKALCHRDLDTRAEPLRTLLRMAARHGLAKVAASPDGDPQPFMIAILPAVVDVLSEHAISRFGAHLNSGMVGSTPTDGALEEGGQ
ncbi:DUF4194 domain-containing protein [Pseudomonas aeruginosa]|nr:DUF4194 domain-containing protein [Pseudomonas aeruginosa]